MELKLFATMSDLETQARIMHTSDQIREQLKGIQGWEKEMKQKDAQRKLAELKEVGGLHLFSINNVNFVNLMFSLS